MNDDKGLAALNNLIQEQKQDGGWNYRVFLVRYGDEAVYEMREAFFQDAILKDTTDASKLGYSEAQPVIDYSLDGIRHALTRMLNALDKPVIELQGVGDNPNGAAERTLDGALVLGEVAGTGKIIEVGGGNPYIDVQMLDSCLPGSPAGIQYKLPVPEELARKLGRHLYQEIEVAFVLRQKRG